MAGGPHRREAAAKGTVSWEEKVKTELFEYPPGSYGSAKLVKMGRWDPYDRFTKKEELTKFFSGRNYRRHSLIDRENFAKFAIAETLQGHPDDYFKVTGEVMKNEFVNDQSDEPGALDGLARAIRADGQRDVDVEVPKDHTTHSSRPKANESKQKISAAAQSIIAASLNSLGPPIDPCAAYLRMTKCGRYGRSNSTVWRSPFIPTLDNRDGRRGLLDHQVTAIVWLLSRLFGDLPTLKYFDPDTGRYQSNIINSSDETNRNRLKGPRYFGGILADSMGLGKTLITVALVDLLIRHKLNVKRDEDGKPTYRPILLITPNATVANQWVQEFSQVIDESILHHIVVSGPGLEASSNRHRVIHLDREDFGDWPDNISYMWDNSDPRASQVVLIMTMESWAARTCARNEEQEWISSFTEQGREFSLVVVDEAYKVKNPATRNWRSVYFLKRQFTLLITATPCMNSLVDLFGLARLLWTAPEEYIEQDPELSTNIDKIFKGLTDLDRLDCYPSSHDFQLIAGRPGLLAKLLFKHKNARTQDIDLTRKYLKYFETLAMLKRSPSSYLYSDWEKTKPISLEGLFPKVENYTIDISVEEAYNQEYQMVHMDLLIDYLEGLKDWGGGLGKGRGRTVKKETKEEDKKDIKKEDEEEETGPMAHSIRLLQLASSSLDVYDLDTILRLNKRSTLSPDVANMREKGVNLLRLAQFLIPLKGARPDTHIGWMKLVARNSPILRYILYYIHENILTRKENGPINKLLIIEQNPMLAFYYELVLQFLGFECRCMHAQLSQDKRQQLVDSFNSSKYSSCQILIQLYTVGFAGTNLHKNCSRVLVASQSYSLPVQWQAIHRVIRVGQNSDVTVHRVKFKNSFHTFRESRQIEKILPELGARAQGDTKKVLVQLLNLFHYEVRNAWKSPDGQKLLHEKNLLEDDEGKDGEEPAAKKIKREDEATHIRMDKIIKEEEEDNIFRIEPISMIVFNTNATTSSISKKRGQEAIAPKPGDGSDGWYNHDAAAESDTDTDTDAFLALQTRDSYYGEFIDLPQKSRSLFSHEKNNLRRLLSYGNCGRELLTAPWAEGDLENPAVLERALELMLRVRLGASDIAMLPFPLIELSGAHAPRRRRLQRLLAEMRHTDQDVNQVAPTAASVKDLREPLRCSDVKKPLAEIERDLKEQAKFGDLKKAKKESERQLAGSIFDESGYSSGDSEGDKGLMIMMLKNEAEADTEEDEDAEAEAKEEEPEDEYEAKYEAEADAEEDAEAEAKEEEEEEGDTEEDAEDEAEEEAEAENEAENEAEDEAKYEAEDEAEDEEEYGLDANSDDNDEVVFVSHKKFKKEEDEFW
ncbi:P-loop containing nucleoside triphosphate hydrolase protein [Xylaria cf. heliscus]|nr:P-loop containing nucleoside triphosphate hydrolase protein [Xylaria cf. heliscus]